MPQFLRTFVNVFMPCRSKGPSTIKYIRFSTDGSTSAEFNLVQFNAALKILETFVETQYMRITICQPKYMCTIIV